MQVLFLDTVRKICPHLFPETCPFNGLSHSSLARTFRKNTFLKIVLAGGANLGSFGFRSFSLPSSALDHLATAPSLEEILKQRPCHVELRLAVYSVRLEISIDCIQVEWSSIFLVVMGPFRVSQIFVLHLGAIWHLLVVAKDLCLGLKIAENL